MSLFQLEALGGPWGRRLQRRRASVAALPWCDAVREPASALAQARWVWTQSAFSEYASAASFAAIAAALLEAGAPLDLCAAAGEFVADELFHAELCARLVTRFGGAVPLEVDLGRLVRPPASGSALVRAAELVVRTCCVGEALTLPLLKTSRDAASCPVVHGVLARIARDESSHAQLGPWMLDWALPRLTPDDLARLGVVAGEALRAFAPVLGEACSTDDEGGEGGLGVLDCASYDRAFAEAVARRVVAPLRARGVRIPEADLASLPAAR